MGSFLPTNQKIKNFSLKQKYTKETLQENSKASIDQELMTFLEEQFESRMLTTYGKPEVKMLPHSQRSSILESIESRREEWKIEWERWRSTWSVFRNKIMSA